MFGFYYVAGCVSTVRYFINDTLSHKGAVWGDSTTTIIRAKSTLQRKIATCFQHVSLP